MLNAIILRTVNKVEFWKKEYAEKKPDGGITQMNLIKEISDHLLESIEECVFG